MKKVDITNWKPYKIGDLFFVVKGTRLTKANMVEGNINFIGASAVNNGVTAHIGNTEHIHPSGTLTVSYNGSVGETFYQTKQFWASDDVNVLYPKFDLSKYIALFFIPIIKRIGTQYAFVDKWKKEDMENETIYLPSVSNGSPDYLYMENYMKNLEKQQRANLDVMKLL